MNQKVSLILPAHNEAPALATLLPQLKRLPGLDEIIVINDASEDDTVPVCRKYDVNVVNQPYRKGNGAAVKIGARMASGDILLFMDADGQHRPEDIQALLDGINKGYDMVVGARDRRSHASLSKFIFNAICNRLAGYMSGHRVRDLTSGFRAVRADVFRKFLYLLPNGFSYPSTITIALFYSGYSVQYTPIQCNKRVGKSHIRIIRDTFRFLVIIFRISVLYSPLKLFGPASLVIFTSGILYYLYTYFYYHQFTNMGLLILLFSVILFMFGLLSQQITFLIYSNNEQQNK